MLIFMLQVALTRRYLNQVPMVCNEIGIPHSFRSHVALCAKGLNAILDFAETKEPSRAHLRSLQAVLVMLLESPSLQEDVDANYVRKAGYINSNFTANECKVVARLANLLRPFVPKRRSSSDGSLPHITLRVPIVLIANAVLRATGYHHFMRIVCPQISPASLQGLILGARGLYEVFCARTPHQFDVVGVDNTQITDGHNVTRVKGNRKRVFEAFFDLSAVEDICKKHVIQVYLFYISAVGSLPV